MGVTGSGKSTVGGMLADALGVTFVEGDDYHPAENIQRMAAGIPLTDADRSGWLRALASRLGQSAKAGEGLVITCSALKKSYRDILRTAAPEVQFIFLDGSRSLIADRVANRRDHFMPATLLDSQLSTLEPPTADENAWVIDIGRSPGEIVDEILKLRAT
jgi:gluconokinase